MGKHERDWAEEAEIAVADAINGIETSIYTQKIATDIVEHISKNYKCEIKNAKWVGSESYEDKGDVHVFLLNGIKVPVELKFSRDNGSGTKANPTTAILKKYISNDIKTYPEVDQELGLKDQRYRMVEEKIGRPIKNTSDYEKNLRHIRDTGGKEFCDMIADVTAPGQEQYALYAANECNKNLDNVNTWVKSVLNGNNTSKSVDDSDELVYCVIKKFESEKQTVEFYDFTAIDSHITEVRATGKSICFDNKNDKTVIRLSVHWKNICQGGKSPCFNVFVGINMSI